MANFGADIASKQEPEKAETVSAMTFGLACFADFVEKMEADTGTSSIEILRVKNIPFEKFVDLVLSVCRSEAYRSDKVSKPHWNVVEKEFLKQAYLFSLLSDPR